jgi:serine/threonine-protein kinase
VSLSEGTRLGIYEVTGQIGAGGMGEVYRATDTKLGREVAIKTLPVGLADDPDRLARFEREAKLLASLNHAHIASVHGLDEQEGTLYIAMELVEGSTLEEKLKAGPLTVDDALQVALQIASALEAAHEKGVVHRDLKPANVMLTNDGIVKVLDFGLAKAFSGDPAEASPGQSPALSVAMTQQGLILGTAGYMSPEQASGQATDQRADIWAFGVVLYEMLTGQALFSGESVAHILGGVLRLEPDWSLLPDGLDPRLKRVLERCLKKRPRERYHAIADVRIDIDEILREPASVALASIEQAAVAPASALRRFALPAAVGIAMAVVAGLAVWSAMLPEPPVPLAVNRFAYHVPAGLDFRRNGARTITLSPDGRHFAFNTTEGLYLRRLGELEAQLVPGTEEDLRNPIFSPDGQSIAYESMPSSAIKRISISGGAPVIMAGNMVGSLGADWTSDGTIFWSTGDTISRFSANGGTPEVVIAAEADGRLLDGPQLLPDGDKLLFSVGQLGNWDPAEIVVQSLATGERTVVLSGGSDARYLPTGHLVYAYEDNLFGIAFDLETLTVSGGPVPLVQGLVRSAFTAAANYGISNDGTLVYLTGASFGGGGSGAASLVWVDRDGNETPTGAQRCNCAPLQVALSPDDSRAAVVIAADGDADIWIWSFTAGTLTRLTFEAGNQGVPIWSRDGQSIIYVSAGEGILKRAADGTGTIETLLADPSVTSEATLGQSMSLDADDNVVFVANGPDVHVLNVADGTAAPLLAETFGEIFPALSRDGRFIAYQSNESGQDEVFVRPYPDVDSGKWQVSSEGGALPKWSADGSRLVFVATDSGTVMESAVTTESSFSRQTPMPLFQLSGMVGYDTGTDAGRYLLLNQGVTDETGNAGQTRMVIVENWIEELERLVPTN